MATTKAQTTLISSIKIGQVLGQGFLKKPQISIPWFERQKEGRSF
jgi:hypothetical protein